MDDESCVNLRVRSQNVHLDIAEKDMQELAVGDKVVLRLEGKVRSVSAPYEYEDGKGKLEKEEYGNLSLKIEKLVVAEKGDNEYVKLSQGED